MGCGSAGEESVDELTLVLTSTGVFVIGIDEAQFFGVELVDVVEHLAREEELVEDHVDLVEVEDEVELAHVAEVVVQDLDEEVDRLEERELVVVDVDAEREEQPGVPAVDDLVRAKLGEICKLWISVDDEAVDLELELVLLVVVHRDVVLRRAGLTLAILQEQKPDHPSDSLRVHPLVQLKASRDSAEC